jgi:hypothetical protein
MTNQPTNREAELSAGAKILASVAGLVTVPAYSVAGSALLEALAGYSARKNAAMLDHLLLRLKALEDTGILEINELARRESFLSLLLTACSVAQRTQRKEKIQRLQNLIIFGATHNPNVEETDSFLHLLDQLSEEHFVVLQTLSEHLPAFTTVNTFSELYGAFCEFYPYLAQDAFGHYLYDLKYRRLIRLSPTIEDEEGLTASTVITRSKGETAIVIISDVAKQLLEVTKSH